MFEKKRKKSCTPTSETFPRQNMLDIVALESGRRRKSVKTFSSKANVAWVDKRGSTRKCLKDQVLPQYYCLLV